MEKQHIFLKTTENFLRKRYNSEQTIKIMRAVITKIHKTAVSPNQISPNFINELANKNGT
jgi:hypothetical protein